MSINLAAGQKVSLSKESSAVPISKVTIGLGWDPAVRSESMEEWFSSGGSIDLDASCVLINNRKHIVDTVSYRQLVSKDGSVVHMGDNESGEGSGDDEQIVVDLNNVPASIEALVFTVNSFSGQAFNFIENAFCRLINARDNQEIARYELSAQGSHSAMIMVKLYRENNTWLMQAIGESGDARSIEALLPQIVRHL